MECLTKELDRLRMDLGRQEALASRRGEVIAELKDEACTQWASGWLSFQRRASRAFPDLDFNIHLSAEEVEGYASEAEVDAGTVVFSGAPDRAPLLGDSRVPPGPSSSSSPTRDLLQRQAFRLFYYYFLVYPGVEPGFLYCF